MTSELEVEALKRRVKVLEAAIRQHKDQKADDRCWIDDSVLYAALGEGFAESKLPPKEEFLANCARFHEHRQNPNHPYVPKSELTEHTERLIEILKKDKAEARKDAKDYREVLVMWREFPPGHIAKHHCVECATHFQKIYDRMEELLGPEEDRYVPPCRSCHGTKKVLEDHDGRAGYSECKECK